MPTALALTICLIHQPGSGSSELSGGMGLCGGYIYT